MHVRAAGRGCDAADQAKVQIFMKDESFRAGFRFVVLKKGETVETGIMTERARLFFPHTTANSQKLKQMEFFKFREDKYRIFISKDALILLKVHARVQRLKQQSCTRRFHHLLYSIIFQQ